jgi:hypothetical protein
MSNTSKNMVSRFSMGSRLLFDTAIKKEEIRFGNNQLALYTSEDPKNWWKNSKQSLAIISDIME